MKLLFDLEADGYLEDCTEIHCLVAKSLDTGKISAFSDKDDTLPNIREGLIMLSSAEVLYGHNILDYDLRVIEKLYNWRMTNKTIDTLVLSRLLYPDLHDIDMRDNTISNKNKGSHSLGLWGHRLGFPKIEFNDFSKYTKEMLTYCIQDVELNARLLDLLKSKRTTQQAVDIEHEFKKIILKQEEVGVPFDAIKAEKLRDELLKEKELMKVQLQSTLPPVVKQLKTKTKSEPFNPNSRTQIISFLQTKYNWIPSEFTEKGNPAIGEDILDSLPYPEAKQFSEYLKYSKVLSQLADGDNAWLKLQKNGVIYGKVITNGAVTGRCTHHSPNLAQVPAGEAFKGPDCRKLFYAPAGYKMIGTDASGLELRMLSHYLHPYDGGVYADIVLNGDIHTENQKAAGLSSRNQAKTFIYAFLYGAGNEKLGEIVDPLLTVKQKESIGKTLRESFVTKIPALGRLLHDVKTSARARGYLIGIDGRVIPTRAEYSALNALLQNAGAIAMKMATIIYHRELYALDLHERVAQVLHVHDEFEVLCPDDIVEYVAPLGPKAIAKAGQSLGFKIRLDGEYKIGNNWYEVH